MQLRALTPNENKNDELFASAECRQLLEMYDDFYQKFGFRQPWIAYPIIHENKIVGSCGFVGPPNNGTVEVAYWTFKDFEGKGVASFGCA